MKSVLLLGSGHQAIQVNHRKQSTQSNSPNHQFMSFLALPISDNSPKLQLRAKTRSLGHPRRLLTYPNLPSQFGYKHGVEILEPSESQSTISFRLTKLMSVTTWTSKKWSTWRTW
ncbi:hypothetical protein L484_003826 [Morus notabilis]|uniref:Uncharacterized protein n=1 Tax=Morus notabilis TaxID=981085 RepID=W9QCQ2_9ROSA|nr:hypothetical protein L484_003826 [Morus notabilis]